MRESGRVKAGASLRGQWDPSAATKSDGTFDYI